nr:hypothetical protein [Tanacetum cinerariifolium]
QCTSEKIRPSSSQTAPELPKGARATGAAPGISSILNSTYRGGGSPGKSSGNTSEKSQITGMSCSCFFAGSDSVT